MFAQTNAKNMNEEWGNMLLQRPCNSHRVGSGSSPPSEHVTWSISALLCLHVLGCPIISRHCDSSAAQCGGIMYIYIFFVESLKRSRPHREARYIMFPIHESKLLRQWARRKSGVLDVNQSNNNSNSNSTGRFLFPSIPQYNGRCPIHVLWMGAPKGGDHFFVLILLFWVVCLFFMAYLS